MQAYSVVVFDLSNAVEAIFSSNEDKTLMEAIYELPFVTEVTHDPYRNFYEICLDREKYTEENIQTLENVIGKFDGDRVVEDIEIWVTDPNDCAILNLNK
jgi:uncharacterized protein (DUF608 family)